MMGGDIEVSSEVGQGSRFCFTGEFEQRAEKKRPTAERAELDGKRALLVEGPSATRANLLASLDEWGMVTSCSESAQDCLQQLNSALASGEPIDLAILDYRLLGESAMELAERIRGDERFAATRLVMMTSIGRRGEARRAQDAGVDSYLTKPVHPPRLFDCLRLVLAREAEAQPKSQQPLPLITVHSSREEQFRSAPKVLVVEDNVINQRLAVRLVEKMGYRVDVAANGLEAVDAARQKRYHAILMDCQMPELDGYQATQRIRREEDPSRARVPIVALTANALSGVRGKCLDAGMDDFLTKPVRPDALAATLERWVTVSADATKVAVSPV